MDVDVAGWSRPILVGPGRARVRPPSSRTSRRRCYSRPAAHRPRSAEESGPGEDRTRPVNPDRIDLARYLRPDPPEELLEELLEEFEELFELELLDELDELFELELLDEFDELLELELDDELPASTIWPPTPVTSPPLCAAARGVAAAGAPWAQMAAARAAAVNMVSFFMSVPFRHRC
jgi:hypothetical protein